jgi:hypothetical protein
MSIILQPQSSFPIVRQIANHLETDTLYIKAVVRNADGDTIDTVLLDDKGGQRFQKKYRVPIDASGQGAYISIVTSVYTDPGYTTKNPNYGDEENTYLIFDRVTSRGSGGGNVVNGSNLSLQDIRRVVAEEIKKSDDAEIAREAATDALEVPEPPEEPPRWDEVLIAINEVKQTILEQEPPTHDKEFETIQAGLAEIKTAVTEKEVTPETDLTPVYEEIDMLKEEMVKIGTSLDGNFAQQKTFIDEKITLMEHTIENTQFVPDMSLQMTKQAKQPDTPASPQIDLTKLT